ncbi:hypothetical protein E4U11_006082 [Claviceps purpurea]|nr:hypothetical protein E4U11_006082 [Claviceps purpurea]
MSNAVPHEPKVEPPVGTRDSSDGEHLSILSSQTAIPCRLGPADSYAEIEYHKTRPLPSGVQHMDKDEVKEVKPYSEAVLSERGSVGDNLARMWIVAENTNSGSLDSTSIHLWSKSCWISEPRTARTHRLDSRSRLETCCWSCTAHVSCLGVVDPATIRLQPLFAFFATRTSSPCWQLLQPPRLVLRLVLVLVFVFVTRQ